MRLTTQSLINCDTAVSIDADDSIPSGVLATVDEVGLVDSGATADIAAPECVLLSALTVQRLAQASTEVALRVAVGHVVGAPADPVIARSRLMLACGPNAISVVDRRQVVEVNMGHGLVL